MWINRDRMDSWNEDTAKSVDMFNRWFVEFAPQAFRATRERTAGTVIRAMEQTDFLRKITPRILMQHPEILPMMRMAMCPPIARDRLAGLAHASKNLLCSMEDKERPHIPPRMPADEREQQLRSICKILKSMADKDMMRWLSEKREPTEEEVSRSATVVADRLCGVLSDPIIRNAQEERQLQKIRKFLERKRYHLLESNPDFRSMKPGTFSFHTNVPVFEDEMQTKTINVTVDVAIQPKKAAAGDLPLLMEAKSAGDFTNTNKRRKEEATKIRQLKRTYGNGVSYTLFLCGYFDAAYLGYEGAEGIDWIWEHRISDLEKLGI